MKKIFSILIVIICLVSCSEGNDWEDRLPYHSYYTVNCNHFDFQLDGGEYTMDIKSYNSTWNITNIPSWLSLSTTSGSKDTQIVLRAQSNLRVDEDRDCQLYLEGMCGNDLKVDTIYVHQRSILPEITFAKPDTAVLANPTEVIIPISTNIDNLSAQVNGSNWLTAEILKVNNQNILKIILKENEGILSRSGYVNVTAPVSYGSIYRSFSIYQYSSAAVGIDHGYAYADLGLPSGTKWAISNLGVKTETGAGLFYRWAEAKDNKSGAYDKDHYQYMYKFYPYHDNLYSEYGYTKYCLSVENTPYYFTSSYNKRYYSIDYKSVLDDNDNAAKALLGSYWDMPTVAQYEELTKECTWEWTTIANVNGYLVTGPNGKSIFFGAHGIAKDKEVNEKNSKAVYWLKEITNTENEYGRCLDFDASSYNQYIGYLRYYGGKIRAVVAQ